MKEKLFVIRKFVYAQNIKEAIKKEKKQSPDDVYMDDDWRKNMISEDKKEIGFKPNTN